MRSVKMTRWSPQFPLKGKKWRIVSKLDWLAIHNDASIFVQGRSLNTALNVNLKIWRRELKNTTFVHNKATNLPDTNPGWLWLLPCSALHVTMFAQGTGREYQRWGLLIIRRMGPWKKKNVFCRALPKIKLVHFFLNTITGIKTTVQSSKHWHFWRKKTPFFIPKMQLVKKTQEIRPMPASKHSFYSGPFPVSDLSQVWMGSKRGLSLSWVCLVYDKAHQHCTGGNTPNLHNFSRPLF